MSLTNAHIRQRVQRAFKCWRPILGLESWQIDVCFDEVDHLATCAAKPAYEEATLHFNLRAIRAELPNTYLAVEELTLHEMVHALAWKANERTVSRITRALLRARDTKR